MNHREKRWLALAILFMVPDISMSKFHDASQFYHPDDVTARAISTSAQKKNIDTYELDCRMRIFALEFAKEIIDSGNSNSNSNSNNNKHTEDRNADILQTTKDALELSRICQGQVRDQKEKQQNPIGPKVEFAESKATIGTLPATNTNTEYDGYRQQNKIGRVRRSSVSGTTSTIKEENDGDDYNGDDGNMDADWSNCELCNSNEVTCIFVSTAHSTIDSSDENYKENGSMSRPWISIHQALHHARSLKKRYHWENRKSDINGIDDAHSRPKTMLLLREGVHYLQGESLRFSEIDNGLTIRGYPGEEVWISGGVSLKDAVFQPAIKEDHQLHNVDGVYFADLTDILKGYKIPKIPSLFTSTRRYVRARYPDADPEVDRDSIRSDKVLEWTMPSPGTPPTFTLFDFAKNPPQGVPFKNDSTMDGYNQYASGHGGACSKIWGDEADSYWCSNASQGGWAEVDRECAVSGKMQLPVGMTYNRSDDLVGPIKDASSLEGGFVFAWHSQSWAMHMFEIVTHSQANGTMTFAKGGGKQGGRNWCRCDQCTYAGAWCGQHQEPPRNDDRRLIGGDWMIENVKDFLNQPGEYFFDKSTSHIYVKPNSTDDLRDLTLGMLTELIDLRNATSIQIEGLSFRDQAATYMEEGWSAPSGGDWSLRRGGAIFIENSSNVTIRGCHFFRLDGTAIFLSRKTRHVCITRNHFEWLGENAVATWGDTVGYDATSGDFPMYTLIEHNVMRELGIYQKQSSAVGLSKAALTTIRKNIMFNMARAAINFNDMVGGGDVVEGNLIFNTCRESGDHGPINSWDRQAYLTTLKDGTTASFDPLPRTIHHNLIFANYGASQGVDNDDGSSWFHIHHNVFYQADGFKMDYGGHDSIYEYNMAMSLSYRGGPCFNMGSFKQGHGDILRGNRCLLGLGKVEIIKKTDTIYETMRLEALCKKYGCTRSSDEPPFVGRLWGGCEDSHVTLESNEYYTPDGIAMVGCNGNNFYKLRDVESKFGLEVNSTVALLPDVDTILAWARSTLMTTKAVHHNTPANKTSNSTSLS